MTVEIIIDLATEDGSVATKTVKVGDIAWISGHTGRSGCCVAITGGTRLKSSNDSLTLRARIEEAKASDTEPRRG